MSPRGEVVYGNVSPECTTTREFPGRPGWKRLWHTVARDTPQCQGHDPSRHRIVYTTAADMSLSRLNHWLPRGQTHPEIVQGTAEFHHQITDPLLPQADPVLHDTAALDTAVDVLDAQPPLVEPLIGSFLLPGQYLATGVSWSA